MRLNIVPDQPCPQCGAYWGHPNPALDFPNRIKVDNDWKCYNPKCKVGYYRDGMVIELKPTPQQQVELDRMREDFQRHLSLGTWRTKGNSSQFVPSVDCDCSRCRKGD